MNGDGKDDIVAFGYDVAYVTFSYGTGFGGIAQKNNHFCVKYGKRFGKHNFIDFFIKGGIPKKKLHGHALM